MNTRTQQVFDDLRSQILSKEQVWVRGGGSKAALSTPRNGPFPLQTVGLQGICEYDPQEYTLTALAGTPLLEIQAALAENGQYLPFDPPFTAQGATLGGMIASGINGPGRYRYGGMRDFILGIEFMNGQGERVRGGGRVVKNAAGFDLPKLMVGSLGKLGLLLEATFKVFPLPTACLTLQARFPNLSAAVDTLLRLGNMPIDLYGLELSPTTSGFEILARLCGPPESFPLRSARLGTVLGPFETLTNSAEAQVWTDLTAFNWQPAGTFLVKAPLTPQRICALDPLLAETGADRRYSGGGSQAWIAWKVGLDELDGLLGRLGLSGLVVQANEVPLDRSPLLGRLESQVFYARVKRALDPAHRWGDL